MRQDTYNKSFLLIVSQVTLASRQASLEDKLIPLSIYVAQSRWTWLKLVWRHPYLRPVGAGKWVRNTRKEGNCNGCTTFFTPVFPGIGEGLSHVANQVVYMNRPDPSPHLPAKHKLGQHKAKAMGEVDGWRRELSIEAPTLRGGTHKREAPR